MLSRERSSDSVLSELIHAGNDEAKVIELGRRLHECRQCRNLSKADLQALIHGDCDDEKVIELGRQLHECDQCRDSLEMLSAESEFWAKTPELLRGAEASGEFVASADWISRIRSDAGVRNGEGAETADQPQFEFLADEESSALAYPIETLLEPPKHPEMVGSIGKYDVERVVGSGGMGIVLKAHDFDLNRPLAIKILAPHLASNGIARKRFAQEARAAAGVLHPNVIAVHGVNNEGKTPYIVMPYVAGPSLQALVEKSGPLPELEIVRIALQIAAGLSAAHSQGLVHRDVKPANILVEPEVNRVLITDFGLARCEDDASLTRTGWLTGTPNYMSPEQARGERPDQRSDLFSFGSLIYFLSTGRLPFRADTPLSVLTRIQNEEPKPVRMAGASVSKTLEDIITVMLRKAPEDRFQSATELHGVLERHLAHLNQPHLTKPPVVIPEPRRRWTLKSVIYGTLAAIAVALGWFNFTQGDGPKVAHKVVSPRILTERDSYFQREAFAKIEEMITKEQFNGLDRITARAYAIDPDNEGAKFYRAFSLLTSGRNRDAFVLFREVENTEKYATLAKYNMACIYAIGGDKKAAFRKLEASIDLGLCDYITFMKFMRDDDLANLHSDPQFAIMVEKFRKKEDETAAKECEHSQHNAVVSEEQCDEFSDSSDSEDCDETISTFSYQPLIDSAKAFAGVYTMRLGPLASLLVYAPSLEQIMGNWAVHSQDNADKFVLVHKLEGSRAPVSQSLVEKPYGPDRVRRKLAMNGAAPSNDSREVLASACRGVEI